MKGVLVVVVNYRVGSLCLDAVAAVADEVSADSSNRLLIVDNASGDGSDDMLERTIQERGWSTWATLVRSPVNGGFAAGNNFGIRHAVADGWRPAYVHLLNPDTAAEPGALEVLWTFLEANSTVGIAGSRLNNERGEQDHSRFRFPSLANEFESRIGLGVVSRVRPRWSIALPLRSVTEQVDWLAGASMMIRQDVFDDIGLLDEGFFMYFEEVDFCRKALQMGWTCWYVEESRVAHFAGKSSGIDMEDTVGRALPKYWYRSRRRYWVKNHGYAFALFLDCVSGSCEALRLLRLALQRKTNQQPRGFLLGLMGMGFSRGDRTSTSMGRVN
ncbi:MAG: N-acetylglucosaminyl-diphospho-decaprenol L-rhamnosyltransferase [Planctomycetota bacterium]|jgi:N-acetylglucosaminyl-diphospho-decaprenol L-rhamnosyltransferase